MGHAVGIAHLGVPPGQLFQPALRRLIRRGRLFRVLVTDVAQIEADARQDVLGLDQRLGRIAEQAGHFGGRLQPAFGVGVQTSACILDRHAFANTGQYVLQIALDRVVIENIVDGQ